MLTILGENKILSLLILLSLLLSIICQMAAGVIYQSMVHETENMSATENKLLNQCKQKYANYYCLNGKMANTGVFVDKFLQKMVFTGIRIMKLTHLAGQMMMLSVLLTGISICMSLAAGNTLFHIIPYYLLCILSLYLYFSVSGITDIQEKKRAIKINITDYLENHLAPRLKAEKELSLNQSKLEMGGHVVGEVKKRSEKKEKIYAEELESLLEEFFV